MAATPADLVPTHTPFNYRLGIDYDSWPDRAGRSIEADLDQITQNFKLIRIYHDTAVGTADPSTPQIDPTTQEVITWLQANPGTELSLGTNNSALEQLNMDGSFSAGLMTSSTYTDAWVDMLISAYGSATAVQTSLKAILLGNEIDANGPPAGNASFDSYISWIETAFDNLKASLAAKGLGSIPISTTIANYPSVASANRVASEITDYIAANWSSGWNNGTAAVFFNQYTANQTSTDFTSVESYFEGLGDPSTTPGSALDPFLGETGYSSYDGTTSPNSLADQASVVTDIFTWLDAQRSAAGNTDAIPVPLFLFQGFDLTNLTGIESGFGLYDQDASSQPTGLKSGLDSIFAANTWTVDPINVASAAHNGLYGAAAGETLSGLAGNDTIIGLGGADLLFGNTGDDLVFGNGGADTAYGGQGNDLIHGGQGDDALYGGLGTDTVMGGIGNDVLVGGGDADVFEIESASGNDTIADFETGTDHVAFTSAILTAAGAATVDTLLAAGLTTDAAGDALLDLGSGNTLTFTGIAASTITAESFLLL